MPSRRDAVRLLAAAAALALTPAAAQERDAAVERIKAFYAGLEAGMKGDKAADAEARANALGEGLIRAFDLGAMTRLAIGPRWRNIPKEKQLKIQVAFSKYFVATYASRLSQASGGRFEVAPKSEPRTGGRLVKTTVTDGEGKATAVDYLVNPEGKVIDVYLNGTISELASQRPQLEAALKQGGPDALEKSLSEKAEELMKQKPK